jgi:hypothetical protein
VSFTTSGVVTSTTLAANTPAQIAGQMLGNRLLIIANNGAGSLVWKTKTAPASATDGVPLDPASSAGGQGGSIVLTGDVALSDAIYAWSTAGTTVTVLQGSTHP